MYKKTRESLEQPLKDLILFNQRIKKIRKILYGLGIFGLFILGRELNHILGIRFVYGAVYCAIGTEILRRIKVD